MTKKELKPIVDEIDVIQLSLEELRDCRGDCLNEIMFKIGEINIQLNIIKFKLNDITNENE
jgi:hypothetical protein